VPETTNISAKLKIAKFINVKLKKSITKFNLTLSIKFPSAPHIIKTRDKLNRNILFLKFFIK